MNMNEYQAAARATALYPLPVIYPALKLAGEAGEVAEKVGKLIRDKGLLSMVVEGVYGLGGVSSEDTDALVRELGDVLWYIAALAGDLGVSLEDIARVNIEKLASRTERGTLRGSGDDR